MAEKVGNRKARPRVWHGPQWILSTAAPVGSREVMAFWGAPMAEINGRRKAFREFSCWDPRSLDQRPLPWISWTGIRGGSWEVELRKPWMGAHIGPFKQFPRHCSPCILRMPVRAGKQRLWGVSVKLRMGG